LFVNLKRRKTLKQLRWFVQKLFLPFVLGIVCCVSLTALFSITNTKYLLGWASDRLLPVSLPKTVLLRPLSDLVPFALMFIVIYHLYNFAKDSYMRKEAITQFMAGIFAYLLATKFVEPFTVLCLCVFLPPIFLCFKEKQEGYPLDPAFITTTPFRMLGWTPGYLFGLGLSQGFLIALPYFIVLLCIPYAAIYLLCLLFD
jgi:hypothetical protein